MTKNRKNRKKNFWWRDEIDELLDSFRHVDFCQCRECTGKSSQAKAQLENRFNFQRISSRTREEGEEIVKRNRALLFSKFLPHDVRIWNILHVHLHLKLHRINIQRISQRLRKREEKKRKHTRARTQEAANSSQPVAQPQPVAQQQLEAESKEEESIQSAVFIPFGKHVERDPSKAYILATGIQECLVCKNIILEAFKYGPNFGDLCELMVDEMQEMCRAQQRVLQSCPEFTNNWCYQDLGGTQQLRSPCPDFLKCHYCLGMNPLHCLDVQ